MEINRQSALRKMPDSLKLIVTLKIKLMEQQLKALLDVAVSLQVKTDAMENKMRQKSRENPE